MTSENSMPFYPPQHFSPGMNPGNSGYIAVQPTQPQYVNQMGMYTQQMPQQSLISSSANNFSQMQQFTPQPQGAIDRVIQNVTDAATKLSQNAIAAMNEAKQSKFTGDPLMPLPPKIGIPRGLEHLADLNEVIIQRDVEFLPSMSGMENSRRYYVINNRKERVYFFGNEEDRAWDCLCCGCCCCVSIPPDPSRPFLMALVDFSGRPVVSLERPRDWALYTSIYLSCFCPFLWMWKTSGKAIAKLPDGTQLGEIVDKHGSSRPDFDINDVNGRLLMKIRSESTSDFQLLRNAINDPNYAVTMYITAEDGTEIGRITEKVWATTIHVTFVPNLDVKWKSLILCCLFLTEFKNEEQKRMPRKTRRYAE